MILQATGLSRRYGERWAVAGVQLRLSRGRSLLVAGHNGAGKTTLLRLLSTALRPTLGTVTIAGIDGARDPDAARRHVALLAQRNGLYLDLSALDNLRIMQRLLGKKRDDDQTRALLARVGLAGREDDGVRRFSSGMRKRLAFAKVLLSDADVVLLDEPYGQLDPQGLEFVDGLLRDLIAQERSVVMVTHVLERAIPLLDAGLVLSEGKMAWVGPAAEILGAVEANL